MWKIYLKVFECSNTLYYIALNITVV